MPSLPVVSGKQARKALELLGWQCVRQKGSHMIMVKEGSIMTISIPDHDELDRGLLKHQVINKAGLSVEDFIRLVNQ